MLSNRFAAVSLALTALALPACEGAATSARPAPAAKSVSFLARTDAAHDTAFESETYDRVVENAFLSPHDAPLSTFSIDVDTASYSNVRRFIDNGALPPPGATRIEEMINYFTYTYPQPEGDAPFSVTTEVAPCPWNAKNRLVHIGLQGRRVERDNLPPCNLVFLIDVSGSMRSANKLALVKDALKLLTKRLRTQDTVSIAVYAGAAGAVLPPTSGAQSEAILDALDDLRAGGSTNGGEGLELAYGLAKKAFVQNGVNRVILCTDGDFNVGVSNQSELIRMIERERESGVALTALGFGMGNYKDSTLEKLADHGNGNYAYIDNQSEARRMLVTEAAGTLWTIAKDVKIQVEFNPERVAAYRLIGYENRLLADADFNDDQKDAGEIGAGHSVTALYEVTPVDGSGTASPGVDPLRYQSGRTPTDAARSAELLTLKLRYKDPQGAESRLLSTPVIDHDLAAHQTTQDFRFAAAVAGFGMLLRASEFRGEATYEMIRKLAREGLDEDADGRRAEFLKLVADAASLSAERDE